MTHICSNDGQNDSNDGIVPGKKQNCETHPEGAAFGALGNLEYNP